ncbi:MAG: hypothetical protein MUE62_03595 [Burkholderiaceae bacterium]|jgi:hypothetical protein|nr:hypothetical protein [Burkholderiaceae bacterium]
MLHRNMDMPAKLRLDLDDLLADLQHARRQGDLGRLALVAFCDVRRWARHAGEPEIADLAAAMFSVEPHPSRAAFLESIDRLIDALTRAQMRALPLGAPPGAGPDALGLHG